MQKVSYLHFHIHFITKLHYILFCKCLESRLHLVNFGFDGSYNYFVFSLLIKVIILNFKLNMEQSFKNENTYDVFMNEVKMEAEPLKEPKENASVQTRGSKNPKN